MIVQFVSFETARLVFDDPHVLSIQDRVVEGEERWQTVGMVSGTVIVRGSYLSGRAWRRGDQADFGTKGNRT